jgi:hypothetical protein
VSGLVNDALVVLGATAEVELDATQAGAVALLALVGVQDVEPGERPGSWRITRRVARDRVISTVDPQARACPQDRRGTPGRLQGPHRRRTRVRAGDRVCADGCHRRGRAHRVKLLAAEEPGLEVLGDSGYGSGATRAAGHSQTIKPIPLQSAVRAGSPSTTSGSTGRLARSGASRATPHRSPARAGPASPAGASTARCAGAAPLPSRGARSACIGTRRSCAPPAAAQ